MPLPLRGSTQLTGSTLDFVIRCLAIRADLRGTVLLRRRPVRDLVTTVLAADEPTPMAFLVPSRANSIRRAASSAVASRGSSLTWAYLSVVRACLCPKILPTRNNDPPD